MKVIQSNRASLVNSWFIKTLYNLYDWCFTFEQILDAGIRNVFNGDFRTFFLCIFRIAVHGRYYNSFFSFQLQFSFPFFYFYLCVLATNIIYLDKTILFAVLVFNKNFLRKLTENIKCKHKVVLSRFFSCYHVKNQHCYYYYCCYHCYFHDFLHHFCDI